MAIASPFFCLEVFSGSWLQPLLSSPQCLSLHPDHELRAVVLMAPPGLASSFAREWTRRYAPHGHDEVVAGGKVYDLFVLTNPIGGGRTGRRFCEGLFDAVC